MKLDRRGFLAGAAAAAVIAPPIAKKVCEAAARSAPVETQIATTAYVQEAIKGFIPCDGRTLLRSQYPELFSVIGTGYGAPSEEEFNIPNLKEHTDESFPYFISTYSSPHGEVLCGMVMIGARQQDRA